MEVQSPGAPSVVPQNSSTSSSIPSSSEVSSLPTSISPMNLENLDKECSALAGLFQQTVNDMKVGLLNPKNLCHSIWFNFIMILQPNVYCNKLYQLSYYSSGYMDILVNWKWHFQADVKMTFHIFVGRNALFRIIQELFVRLNCRITTLNMSHA